MFQWIKLHQTLLLGLILTNKAQAQCFPVTNKRSIWKVNLMLMETHHFYKVNIILGRYWYWYWFDQIKDNYDHQNTETRLSITLKFWFIRTNYNCHDFRVFTSSLWQNSFRGHLCYVHFWKFTCLFFDKFDVSGIFYNS